MCTNEVETEFLNLSLSLAPYSELTSQEFEKISERKSALLQQLKDHEFYFPFWFGQNQNDQQFQPPKTKDQLLAELPSDLSNISEMGMKTHQAAGDGLVEAYLQIQIRKFGVALHAIVRVEEFLERCREYNDIISKEYCDGFKYVISLLRIHLSIVDGSIVDSEEVGILEKGLARVFRPESSFHNLELAAILCVKWRLNELYINRRLDGVATLEKMHELDPNGWFWGYKLCSRVRFQRRQAGEAGNRSYPYAQEIEGISSAYQNAPSFYKARCLAGVCRTLAEILRYRSFHSGSCEELVFGDLIFASNDKIANFILDTAKAAIEEDKIIFGELIRYGEILSAIIPSAYQNFEISELCLKGTLTRKPESSKANHRMGIFQLTVHKDKNNAQLFFENAVRFAPSNFPAWMDLIQLLLSKCDDETCNQRLKTIFEVVLKAKWTTPKQQSSFLFCAGLHKFLKGFEDDAIAAWLEQSALDPTLSAFNNLKSVFKRYLFNSDHKTILRNVVKAIGGKMHTYSDTDKHVFKDLYRNLEIICKGPSSQNGEVLRFPQQRLARRFVSEADCDDCWRKPSTPVQSTSASSSNWYEYHCTGTKLRLPGQPYFRNQRFSNSNPTGYRNRTRNSNTYFGNSGSIDLEKRNSYPKTNRSPSPQSWR